MGRGSRSPSSRRSTSTPLASRWRTADAARTAPTASSGYSAILEEHPPRRLVHEWQGLDDADLAAEEPSRVTWEIEPQDGGAAPKLTLVHDQLEGAPKTAESVAGGWMFILSGLKTLLETGKPRAG